MVRVGIQVSFSTLAHPQTNGKDERFHCSLKAEVVTGQVFTDHAHMQRAFDELRDISTTVRPHQGIGMVVPSTRYRPSPRRSQSCCHAIEYIPHDQVVMVQWNGVVRFKGRTLKVSNALRGMHIAFRSHDTREGIYKLYFAHHPLIEIDLRETA